MLSSRRSAVPQSQGGASQSQRSNGRVNSTQARDDDDSDEELDNFLAPFAKVQMESEYRNQSLSKDAALAKLTALTKEWGQIAKSSEKSMTQLSNAASDMMDALAAEGTQEENEDIKLADANYRKLIDCTQEAYIKRGVIGEIMKRLQLGQEVKDALEFYQTNSSTQFNEWSAKTSRQKYLDSQLYKNFRTALWEAKGTSGGMPALKRFIDREEGDEESEEEDIEIAERVAQWKDPLTLTWLEKPVKTSACSHYFSRASIENYIRQSQSKTYAECPNPGCTKIIHLGELEDDPALERRVQAHVRRVREREEASAGGYQAIDDDEEDE